VKTSGFRASAGLALALMLANAGIARADTARDRARTSSLSWVRTEGADACIASKPLAERVERILGRTVFVSASDAELAIEGRVERRASPISPGASGAPGPPGGWRAVLRVADANGTVVGTREIEVDGEDCHALDDSVAFVVAVMIDPDADRRPKPTAPTTPVAPPVAPSVAPQRWQLHVSGGAEAALGLLPSIAMGPLARLRIGAPVWAAEISGTYLVPQTQGVEVQGAHAEVEWSLAFAGAALCPRFFATADGALSLVACAGVDAGSFRSRGSGFLLTSDSTDAIVLARAGLRGEWRFARRFFAALEPRAAVPLARERYEYTDASGASVPLFRMAAVAGALNLTLGVALE
jgi:hypothetical protein